MSHNATFERFKAALDHSPRNAWVAELHVQSIKFARDLDGLTNRQVTEGLGIGASFGAEISKMRKIAPRLIAAGLDINQL